MAIHRNRVAFRQVASARQISAEADPHAYAGQCETPMPAVEFAHCAASERGEKRTEIYTDIVDIVRGGLAGIVRRVELIDLACQTRKEQSVANGNGRQCKI